jgi:photosystem II stability/assembly factor-like uncharacterized protein
VAQIFLRSEDGGKTWSKLETTRPSGWGPPGIQAGFPIDFQVDPRDPNRVFVNNYGGGNFLTEDGGKIWVSSSTGYTGADLNDVSIDPLQPGLVYVNGRSGPFVSWDAGGSWQGIKRSTSVRLSKAHGSRTRQSRSHPGQSSTLGLDIQQQGWRDELGAGERLLR